jgi:hypothetical protein
MRFHTFTLHALIHIVEADRISWVKIQQAIPGIRHEDMQPAVDRGWLKKRETVRGPSIYEATDDGKAWVRSLCDISEAQPPACSQWQKNTPAVI